MAEHFVVEGFLQRFGGSHDGRCVFVFGFDVSQHVGVFPFAEPEVRVVAGVVVEGVGVRPWFGDGWGGHRGYSLLVIGYLLFVSGWLLAERPHPNPLPEGEGANPPLPWERG